MERYPHLAHLSRLHALAKSDFCNIDTDTLLYKWCWQQFVELELYVDFCEDRQKAYDSGVEWERKQEEMHNKHR